MKVLAVVNPISGGEDKKPFVRHFQKETTNYGIESEIFYTSGKEDTEDLKKIIKDFNPDRIAAVGGDGTTLFTACALMDTSIPFGIIPMGSANGMATELGVEDDPELALSDFLQSHLTCSLDLILVNDEHYCMHIGDVGINANVVEDFTMSEGRGMAAYAKHFLDRIIRKELLSCRIEVDGQAIDQQGYMVAIANSRKYGTGMVLNYKGDPTDGIFEVVILNDLDTATLLKVGLSRFNEELSSRGDDVTIISGKEARITLDSPHTLQLDGELIGKVSEIKARIISSAVHVLTTKKNPYMK